MVENNRFPLEDWRYEVANGDTYLGYTEWLEHKIEANDDGVGWFDDEPRGKEII